VRRTKSPEQLLTELDELLRLDWWKLVCV